MCHHAIYSWVYWNTIGRGGLNIKMLSYQYRNPHVKDKTVLYLTWESSYQGKTVSVLKLSPGSLHKLSVFMCRFVLKIHKIYWMTRAYQQADCLLGKGREMLPVLLYILWETPGIFPSQTPRNHFWVFGSFVVAGLENKQSTYRLFEAL